LKNSICLLLGAAAVACAHAAPTWTVAEHIRLGGEPRWDYLLVDSAAQRLYVAHGNRIDVVDTRSNHPAGAVEGLAGVHGIAVARDLGLGFATSGQAGTVAVFMLSTLQVAATIQAGANPDAIVYDPASHRVLAFNGKSHDVTVIDARAARVVATVPVGGKPEFAQLDARHHAWFNVEDTSELVEFDPAAAQVVGRHSLAPCDSPSGLAIDATATHLFSVCENALMAVADLQGRMIGQPAIGHGADGVAWLDGYAYSANGRDGTLTQVGETAPGRFETLATFPTATGARTIAADPATHRLYLPTASFAAAASGARPAGIPGSFEVLVMATKP
jgi:YVTN family beta-propeller protein